MPQKNAPAILSIGMIPAEISRSLYKHARKIKLVVMALV